MIFFALAIGVLIGFFWKQIGFVFASIFIVLLINISLMWEFIKSLFKK